MGTLLTTRVASTPLPFPTSFPNHYFAATQNAMSTSSDDPALLFSPPPRSKPPPEIIDVDMIDSPSASEPLHSDALSVGDASRPKPTPGLSLFVDVPRLSHSEKKKYEYLDTLDSEDEDPDASEVVEFVGEHKVGKTVFLYARCQDDLFRRVCSPNACRS